MSSRIRYVCLLGGVYLAGSNAKTQMRKYAEESLKTPADFAKFMASKKWKLWVFREPRGTTRAHSRYKKLCIRLGITGESKRRKVVVSYTPTPPAIPEPIFYMHHAQGALYANQQPGLPTQPGPTPTNISGGLAIDDLS